MIIILGTQKNISSAFKLFVILAMENELGREGKCGHRRCGEKIYGRECVETLGTKDVNLRKTTNEK